MKTRQFTDESCDAKYLEISNILKAVFQQGEDDDTPYVYVVAGNYRIGFQEREYFCIKDIRIISAPKILWFYTKNIYTFTIDNDNQMIIINNNMAFKYDC